MQVQHSERQVENRSIIAEGQYQIVKTVSLREEDIPHKSSIQRHGSVETMVDDRGAINFNRESLTDNDFSLADYSNPSVIQSNLNPYDKFGDPKQSLLKDDRILLGKNSNETSSRSSGNLRLSSKMGGM